MSYIISPNGQSITCLECNRTSYNPEDIRQKYCGYCHVYHEDPEPDWSFPFGGEGDG